MDGGERRQPQYGAQYQLSGSGRPAPGQPMGPPPQEQFTRTASSPSRRGMVAQPGGTSYMPEYGYTYQQPQFSHQLQYPSSYVPDPSRTHQLQPSPGRQDYTTYGHGSMLPPVAQHSMYEGMPSYQQQRQSTAIEVMAGQFGSGGLQYMQQNDPGSNVAGGSAPSQYLTSQAEQQPYASMSFARPQLQPPFTPSTSEYTILEQPTPQQTVEEVGSRQATEEGKRQYELRLRATFEAITAGRVREASDQLLDITEWLFGSVRALGLHHDDEETHAQRLVLWRELNHAWEALGQKQKSITETAIRIQQQPAEYLTAAALQSLIDKLVQLCDQVEKFGLVDYEMGLWEEQIIDVFIQCLDLLSEEQTHLGPGSHER